MTVQNNAANQVIALSLTRHFVSDNNTHFFFPYDGNFTEKKSDLFGDKLLSWFDTHSSILTTRWITRTYASTSDRWKNVKCVALDEDTVQITADGVEPFTIPFNKAVFF